MTTALRGLDPTWNLDVFFPGGSQSPEFASFLDDLSARVVALTRRIQAEPVPGTVPEAMAWSELFEDFQEIGRRLRHGAAFVSCLRSQNVRDQGANLLAGRMAQVTAAVTAMSVHLDSRLLAIDDAVWAELLASGRWAAVAAPLDERRERARRKMDPAREALAGDLAVDGYHAWGRLYDTIVGRMSITFEEGGKALQFSVGQTANRMASGDPAVRAEAAAKWEAAWAAEAEPIAEALNHLAGYRLALYKHRGWDSVLQEPLELNRMSEATLRTMWDVIEHNKQPFVTYLERKARLLGLSGLGWFDVAAPLAANPRKISYDEAANFIVEQFAKFNPALAEFSQRAFAERWIEVEDRPGKRPGGFCTGFPLARQSRIFMTFAGTANNVGTLAHELGHAWHGYVMRDLPYLVQGYAMNVAETASTFAEAVVNEAAVRAAGSDEERIALLAEKVQKSVAFYMNIHARFLFETSFYEARKSGLLSADRLGELMVSAQKQAFAGALTSYHPHFWAAKLHFYSTHQPFYNWPYTFGYVFSTGVYARALAEGPAFAAKYDALLRDTGRMRVEDLAAKHLGVDLTQPDFWQSAVDVTIRDVNEFLRLTA